MMKEHIVDTYGEITYTHGQRLLGRLDPAEHGRVDLSRACSTASSRAATSPTRSPPASRSPTACCWSTSTSSPEWTALMSRPDAGADQREEDGDQRPPRPARLPVVEQRVRLQQQAGQLRADRWSINQTTGALAPVGAPRNNCLLPAALVYDPVTNPNGTRCGDADLATAVWGTTAGIARRQRCARGRPATTSASSTA